MARSVIVVDSSPEPEHLVPNMQAGPTMDHRLPDHEIEPQAQGSSSRDKGKQKAPAPIVYEISSDDAKTPPTYDEDDSDVQLTGMRALVTKTAVETTEDSKKRKREPESELSGPPCGFGSGSPSGAGPGATPSSAEGAAPYSTVATAPSNCGPAYSFASTSAAASTSTSTANYTLNAAAGPSGHASTSYMSLRGPVVKKARFETHPAASMPHTGSTASATTTAASTSAASVEHARPAGLVAPLNRATAAAALTTNERQANAPRRVQGVHPPGINAHPPGPYYEGALLPPGHFYHDALNIRAPPAANDDGINNGANNAVNNVVMNFENGQVDFLLEPPLNLNANEIDYNPAALAAATNRTAQEERLERELAGLRERFPDAVGSPRYQQMVRNIIQGQVDQQLALARTREMLRETLREAEERQENMRRAREREEARERYWQRIMMERDRDRERELERTLERARAMRTQNDLALLDLGIGGGVGAMGLGQGLGAAGGLLRRNGYGQAQRRDAHEPPPLHEDNPLDDNFALHEPVNEALVDALGALNDPNINNANGGVNMAFRNEINNIRAEIGALDNDIDPIGDGIAHLEDNLEDALRDLDDLVDNAAGLFDENNLREGNNNNGPYANPLFAPPVAAAAEPAGNGPAQHADAVMFDADRNAHGADPRGLGNADNDIYVPVREGVRAPPAHLPAGGATEAHARVVTVAEPLSAVPSASASTSSDATRSHASGLEPTSQPVAGSSNAAAAVIDVDAFQDAPAPHTPAHPPVAGPSNVTGASGSNSTAPNRSVDPIDTILASILEVVPDVLPEHAATLARTHFPSFGVMHTAEHVLGLLLESKNYPRRGKGKGKGKNKGKDAKGSAQGENAEEGDEDIGADFLNTKIKGPLGTNYRRLAVYHLRQSFPHARPAQLATASSMRYAHGHAFLAERLGPAPQAGNAHNADAGGRAYRHHHRLEQLRAQHYGVAARAGPNMANNTWAPVNGNWHDPTWNIDANLRRDEEDRVALRSVVDKEFAKERRWLERRYGLPKSDIGTGVAIPDAAGAEGGEGGPRQDIGTGAVQGVDNGKGKGKAKEISLADTEDEPVEAGMGVECQCCFTEYAFSRMAQCPDAHLFCVSCISQYAAVQLGNMNPTLTCMHADGCSMPFGELELRRVLPRKLMRLFERVLSQKAVEGLEGLEACPFCEWKCVMDISLQVDRLFRCGNLRDDNDDEEEDEDECGVVSCRLCKKLDHTPKSCQEAEEDKHLDGQHAVEEAMTAALMRNCPKCKKAFIKEGGCNKMTCPYCGTHSCYTCRKQINGYDHFDLRPLDPGEPVAPGKCRTHDTRQLEEIHANEVKAAAEKALAEYKAAHPDAGDGDIKVDIPEAPPAPQRYLPRNRQHIPMLGIPFGRQRVADILAGNHNVFVNAPRNGNGIGGAAAAPAVPGQGAARPAHRDHYPVLPPVAHEHLAHYAGIGAMRPLHMRFGNGAGNAQPPAAEAVRPAPPPPPLQQAQNANFHLRRGIEYGLDPMPFAGVMNRQGQNELPPQDIVMADARPLNDPNELMRRRMINVAAARQHARAAAVPQPQAAVPPAPLPYVYPNVFFPRLDAPAAPPQPPPPQLAPAPRYLIGPHDYLHHLRQNRLAPNVPADPGLGALEQELIRAYPGLFPQRPVRRENAVAGPPYPGIRAMGDHPLMRHQPLFVPPAIHPPAPAPPIFPAPPAPVLAPTANIPQVPGVGQGDNLAMGMGTGFGHAMDVDMGMGFGPGMGVGVDMGMHIGAGRIGNHENRPLNPPQGQGDAGGDVGGHHMGP